MNVGKLVAGIVLLIVGIVFLAIGAKWFGDYSDMKTALDMIEPLKDNPLVKPVYDAAAKETTQTLIKGLVGLIVGIILLLVGIILMATAKGKGAQAPPPPPQQAPPPPGGY